MAPSHFHTQEFVCHFPSPPKVTADIPKQLMYSNSWKSSVSFFKQINDTYVKVTVCFICLQTSIKQCKENVLKGWNNIYLVHGSINETKHAKITLGISYWLHAEWPDFDSQHGQEFSLHQCTDWFCKLPILLSHVI
jgi:hypothetical protein